MLQTISSSSNWIVGCAH